MDLTDLVHHILVVEGDEAKASVSVSHLVIGQHGLLDLGELLEIVLDILQAGGGRQSADKDLLGSHHQIGIGLARNSNLKNTGYKYCINSDISHSYLGLNQFSIQLMSWVSQDLIDAARVGEGDEAESS